MNYDLNNKISSQDQNCEFIENTVISYHNINRCMNRSDVNNFYIFVLIFALF